MWRARERHPWVGVVLGLAMTGSAGVALMLLDRTPSFVPGLGLVVVAVTAVTVPVLALRPAASRAKIQVAAAGLGLAMLLAGPAAYAADTMQTAYSGGTPSAGPNVTGSDGGNGGFGGNGGPTAQAGGMPGLAGGQPPTGATGGSAGLGAFGGGPGGSSLDTATLDYLVANQGSATWLLAVSDSTTASQVELSTGRAVMSTGGFTGSDNALTLEQLKAYVASGELRFVEVGGRGGGFGGPNGGSSASGVSSWVASACTAATIGGTTSSSLYDCAAAAAGG